MSHQRAAVIKNRSAGNQAADNPVVLIQNRAPGTNTADTFTGQHDIAVRRKASEVFSVVITKSGCSIQSIADDIAFQISHTAVNQQTSDCFILLFDLTIICYKTEVSAFIVKGITGAHQAADDLSTFVISQAVGPDKTNSFTIKIGYLTAGGYAADKISFR